MPPEAAGLKTIAPGAEPVAGPLGELAESVDGNAPLKIATPGEKLKLDTLTDSFAPPNPAAETKKFAAGIVQVEVAGIAVDGLLKVTVVGLFALLNTDTNPVLVAAT